MSGRFYPRYVKGNPQLRIFLPDWKMVMVKHKKPLPENVVTFKTDVRMTEWDIKNYLEKIYKVPVAGINSRIMSGEIYRVPDGAAKAEDYRLAHVFLPAGQTFKWPNLFPEEKTKELDDDMVRTLKQLSKGREKHSSVQDVPSWFA